MRLRHKAGLEMYRKNYEREQICGLIIVIGMTLLFLSVLGIRFFNVSVINIEHNHKGLYDIITEKEIHTISSTDVLRIERTYTKTALSGKKVELYKIFTKKGFIYLSSLDSFARTGRQLIETFELNEKNIWFLPGSSLQENQSLIKNYDYAIGTPKSHIPILKFMRMFQNFILIFMAFTLLILIIPVKQNTSGDMLNKHAQEREYEKKQQSIVAK